MQTTTNYGLKKPEGNEYVSVGDLNHNADKIDEVLESHENPEFDDSGTVEGITSFPAFLATVKSKMKIFDFFKNFVAGAKFLLHTGMLVNNGLTTEAGKYPLDAAYGKTLTDMYSQLNDKVTFKYLGSVTGKDVPIALPSGWSELRILSKYGSDFFEYSVTKDMHDIAPDNLYLRSGYFYEYSGRQNIIRVKEVEVSLYHNTSTSVMEAITTDATRCVVTDLSSESILYVWYR